MRTFVISLFILISMVGKAQLNDYYWVKLDSLNIKQTDKKWTGWTSVDLMSCFELNRNRFVIYSPKKIQKFTFLTIVSEVVKNEPFPRFSIRATDDDGVICEVYLWTGQDKRLYVKIKYLNGEYKYMGK